jgi:type I restriction enzyme R subunit
MENVIVRRRRLPHWDVPGAAYFVTTCLEGSIPAQGLLEIAQLRADLRRRVKPAQFTEAAWQVHCWKQAFVHVESLLDARPARRDLEDPVLAQIVVDGIMHFATERYDLLAFVVMPSHIHWVFQPLTSWVERLSPGERTPRERITYSLNRFTAGACNRVLKRMGPFWQTESYDHWVRDPQEMERIMRYIEDNPIKAALVSRPEDWRFSSAWARKLAGTEWGAPLPKDSFSPK